MKTHILIMSYFGNHPDIAQLRHSRRQMARLPRIWYKEWNRKWRTVTQGI